jgi:hypothetical protein
VLDYRRKFIEAAARYNELSYKTMIAEAERMTALKIFQMSQPIIRN